jgi:branched-chain amino acid transport system permease protein
MPVRTDKLWKQLILGGVTTGAVVVVGQAVGDYWLSILISTLVAIAFAIAWNLAAGYAGVFSLGHHLFYGVGAYVSTLLLLKAGLSPWIGLLLAALFTAGLAAAVGAVGFRYGLGGAFFALFTLALAEVARSVAAAWQWIGGPVGLIIPAGRGPLNFSFTSTMPFFYISLAMVVGYLLITLFVANSRLGYYLRAIREDEAAAEASGVNTYRYKILIFALSAGLTSIVGSFYAQYFQYISPNEVFVFNVQLDAMVHVIVGGAGTVLGPVLGAGVFSFLSEALRNLPFDVNQRQLASGAKVFYSIMLIVVALKLPSGIVGLLRRRGERPHATPLRETGAEEEAHAA